ncbi:hypothetical protein Droror1_Dr00016909 [Drosera rotundifolia]
MKSWSAAASVIEIGAQLLLDQFLNSSGFGRGETVVNWVFLCLCTCFALQHCLGILGVRETIASLNDRKIISKKTISKGEEAAEMMMLPNESLNSDVDDGVCCNETKFSCIRDDKAIETNWSQQGHGELEALTSKGVLRNFHVFADEGLECSDCIGFP